MIYLVWYKLRVCFFFGKIQERLLKLKNGFNVSLPSRSIQDYLVHGITEKFLPRLASSVPLIHVSQVFLD